jgi:ribosome-binding factor A
MSQGSRPDRVADQIRSELGQLLAREVHDPGIGFVTITRVQVSPDIQQARVFYTALGPQGPASPASLTGPAGPEGSGNPASLQDQARRNTERALSRALPFLRRQLGSRLRLKRVPELKFMYDESIAGQDRIERLLNEIHAADDEEPGTDPSDR